MNINNPTTFGTPSLTLSTSNSSGTGGALRADDTILVFDTTLPADVLAGSAVVGTATTAPRRDHQHSGLLSFDSTALESVAASSSVGTAETVAHRDHVHPGIPGAGTVVDNAITRFNGTGGSGVQGYSSLSPTISDAGILSLTSGALQFPATAIASADANTLDDYQQATWTPDLQFGGAKVGITYGAGNQVGTYTKIGNFVLFQAYIGLTSKGSSTGNARLYGLPFATGSAPYTGSILQIRQVSFADSPSGLIVSSHISFAETANDGTYSTLTDANFADNSEVHVSGLYRV